jgi:hypothetical protein
MNRTLRFVFGFLLLIAFVFSVDSCREKNDVSNDVDPSNSRILDAPANLSNGLVLPVGTKLVKDNNSEYSFTLPKGYILTGILDLPSKLGAENLLSEDAMAGKITCTCNSTVGSCNPFEAEGFAGGVIIGCSTNRCSDCRLKTSLKTSVPDPTVPGGKRTGYFELGKSAIINTEEGIHFITSVDELNASPSINEAFLMSKFILKELDNNLSYHVQGENFGLAIKARSPKEMPSDYVLAAVSVYGHVMYLPVNSTRTASVNPAINDPVRMMNLLSDDESSSGDVTSKYSCKCESGTSGCTLQSKFVALGIAYWCEAGSCRSCTLLKK